MTGEPLIRIDREDGWLVVRWRGDVDMANAKAVEHETLGAILNTDTGVVADLTDVEYIDSAGIRALVAIRRQLAERQQRFMLVVPEDALIRKGLEVGGVMAIIESYATADDARAAR